MRPLFRLERRLEALDGLEAPDVVAELEAVLHDGYAHVLRLEARRARVKRRIEELAARAEEAPAARELRARAEELAGLERDVSALRALLSRAEARPR